MISRFLKTCTLLLLTVVAGVGFGSASPEAFAGGGACHEAPVSMDTAGDTVTMTRNCFSPTVLRVETGAQVTFQNDDAIYHNVAGVANAWGTRDEMVHIGKSAKYAFDAPGIYPYACNLHFGMVGAVVVGDGRMVSAANVREVAVPVSQSSNAPAADSGQQTAPSTAAIIPLATDDSQSPLLFAALGALIGAVAVGLGFSAKHLRR